jgi:hypothetical protein
MFFLNKSNLILEQGGCVIASPKVSLAGKLQILNSLAHRWGALRSPQKSNGDRLDQNSPCLRPFEWRDKLPSEDPWVVELPADADRMAISADTLPLEKSDPLILADCV